VRTRINTWLQGLWSRWGVGETTVALAQCVHYGAFRYGRAEYNPYETYLADLMRDGDHAAARARLLDFLQYYRPQNFGDAIGARLEQVQPLWLYPWSREMPAPAWVDHEKDCPDILTHFMAQGIARRRLEEEFGWLERALTSIRQHGYQPKKFHSAILARKLVRADGTTAYLLLDGNHRVAALAALGHHAVAVCCPPWLVVRESDLSRWPQVRRGAYTPEDARRVLQAYFEGNHRPRTGAGPARLVGEPA
jgi:hypothetical protein